MSSQRIIRIGVPQSLSQEVTDFLVIFSVLSLSYWWITEWGGTVFFQRVLRVDMSHISPLYFCAVALIVFSLRRIGDQQAERARRLAAEQNAYLASTRDPLTQLPNRRKFQEDVGAILQNSENSMSVLLLGLDHFRKLNEVYGHLGCDEAIAQIGDRIRESMKPGDLAARVGDDEFAICLTGMGPENALKAGSALLATIKQPVQIGIQLHAINASIGIVQAGRGHTTVDELLRCAHVALSRARNSQIDCCFFDPKMDAHVRARALMETDLRDAIGGYDIRPYYQPIVDLKTQRIVSFESLARWHHPMNGMIVPDTFIPLAEELGLMDGLSGQLFGDSCRDAATWPDNVSLSFNFSPTQLSDANFARDVLTILADTGLPPHRLEAEITESAIVSDFEATRHAIQTLRDAGIRIVLDDFGTGYSGLSQLYELRFDKLKIDKRFIKEIGKSSESDIFMRAIFGLCKGLNLIVTAEGIENAGQAEAVCAYGAQQGQGFLFSKAVPAEEVMGLLDSTGPTKQVA